MDSLATIHPMFRAFVDPTRVRILNLLLERELCVCELCELLEMVQPKISRHLAYLRRAELVTVRQDGKWKYYAVPPRPGGLAKKLLSCVRSCLREIDVLRDDLIRLETQRDRAPCR